MTHAHSPTELERESLVEKIDAMRRALPPGGVTLAELLAEVGQDGLLLLAVFLSVVFLVPVSLPGVSTVFGMGILLIGVSRALGSDLWVPKRIAARRLDSARLQAALAHGAVWLHRLERIARPHRLPRLVHTPPLPLIHDFGLILAAILLMFPFGFVPLSNTLPGIATLLLAIGLLARDGLTLLLGHLMNVATMIYFTVLIVGGGTLVWEQLRAWLGV